MVPKAARDMEKARSHLGMILPDYFAEFDNSAAIKNLQKQCADDKDCFPLLSHLHDFIADKNFNASTNPHRQALASGTRLELHTSEAAVLHRLRAQVELLEAYRWHQISSRRQDRSLLALQSMSASDSNDFAVIQVDFKENVKYPLSTSPRLWKPFFSNVISSVTQ